MELSEIVQNDLHNLVKLDNSAKVINKAFETIVNSGKGMIVTQHFEMCNSFNHCCF